MWIAAAAAAIATICCAASAAVIQSSTSTGFVLRWMLPAGGVFLTVSATPSQVALSLAATLMAGVVVLTLLAGRSPTSYRAARIVCALAGGAGVAWYLAALFYNQSQLKQLSGPVLGRLYTPENAFGTPLFIACTLCLLLQGPLPRPRGVAPITAAVAALVIGLVAIPISHRNPFQSVAVAEPTTTTFAPPTTDYSPPLTDSTTTSTTVYSPPTTDVPADGLDSFTPVSTTNVTILGSDGTRFTGTLTLGAPIPARKAAAENINVSSCENVSLDRDAVIPGDFESQNASGFETQFTYELSPSSDASGTQIYGDFSNGPECEDSLSANPDDGGEADTDYTGELRFFVVLSNYYSPDEPNGDPDVEASTLTLSAELNGEDATVNSSDQDAIRTSDDGALTMGLVVDGSGAPVTTTTTECCD